MNGSRRLARHLALLLTTAATMMAAASSARAAGTLERIQARGSIIVGHRDSSVPLSYVVDGKPVGYAVDICAKVVDAIAKNLKMKSLRTEYVQVTSGNRIDFVEQGKIDLECGSTTNTLQRRERVAFTIPHFIASSRVMVRSADPYDRIEDLDNKQIASTTGTTNLKSLEREATLKGIKVTVVPSKDHAEAVAWVQSGKVDGFAMDDVLLFGLRANAVKPDALKIIGKPITMEPYSIMFERNNAPLKAIIDSEMRRMIMSRELHQLYDKWFLGPIPPKGMNLQMKMPYLFSDSLKYPTDFVPN